MPITGVDAERDLLIKLRFEMEKQGGLATASGAVAGLRKGLDTTAESAEQGRRKLMEMRENAEKLQQVGMLLGLVGAAITGPMLLAANSYVKTAGQSEAVSRQWLAATKELEAAQMKIGKTVAQEVLPYLKTAADVAEKVADMIEKNPWIARAALTAGSLLAASGAALTIAAQVQRLIATVQLLTGAGVAAQGGGIVGTAMAAKASISGAIAAQTINSAGYGTAAAAATGGVVQAGAGASLATLAAPFAAVLAGGISAVITGKLASDWGRANLGPIYVEMIRKALGNSAAEGAKEFFGLGKAIEETTKATATTTEELQAYINAKKQEADAVAKYNEQRNAILEQQSQAQAQYMQAQMSSMMKFANDMASIMSNEANARAGLAKQHSTESVRAEQDRLKAIKAIRERYTDQEKQAVDDRDALALIRIQEAKEKEIRAVNESAQDEAKRRDEDYAARLSEINNQYAAERMARLSAFMQEQTDQANQYMQQRAGFQQQLSELEKGFQTEKAARKKALDEQLLDLQSGLDKEKYLKSQISQAELAQLEAMLAQARAKVSNMNGATTGASNGTITPPATGSTQSGSAWWDIGGMFGTGAAATNSVQQAAQANQTSGGVALQNNVLNVNALSESQAQRIGQMSADTAMNGFTDLFARAGA